jgi:hypothetical protein
MSLDDDNFDYARYFQRVLVKAELAVDPKDL